MRGPEIRDYDGGNDYAVVDVPAFQSIAILPAAQLDPIVRFFDPKLEALLADNFGILHHPGEVAEKYARPLRASDLGSLVGLDLNHLDIEYLDGLEFATRLKHLNLAFNDLRDGSEYPLIPRISTDPITVGQQLGLSNLRTLAMDFNRQLQLDYVGLMTKLTALSADHAAALSLGSLSNLRDLAFLSIDEESNLVSGRANISDLSVLANLKKLVSLSLREQGVSDLSPLENLDWLKHLYLDGNQITSIESIAGQRIGDDDDSTYLGLSPSRFTFDLAANTLYGPTSWQGNLGTVADTYQGDYRFQGPDGVRDPLLLSTFVTWRFSELAEGDYDIFVTWPANPDRATHAEWRGAFGKANGNVGGVQTEDLEPIVFDQRLRPDGFVFGGVPWQQIGNFRLEVERLTNGTMDSPTSH